MLKKRKILTKRKLSTMIILRQHVLKELRSISTATDNHCLRSPGKSCFSHFSPSSPNAENPSSQAARQKRELEEAEMSSESDLRRDSLSDFITLRHPTAQNFAFISPLLIFGLRPTQEFWKNVTCGQTTAKSCGRNSGEEREKRMHGASVHSRSDKHLHI